MNQLRDIFPNTPDAKRRFTVDEFEQMGMAGIFGPDERVELIAGEILVMSPTGRFHEVLRTELALIWSQWSVGRGFKIASEMPLRLSKTFEPAADIAVYPNSLVSPDVRGGTALLVVEIADSSLNMDMSVKAAAYAAGGVREYWVINPRTRETIVHREPGANGYASVAAVAAGDMATPLLVPELAMRMSDLPGA